MQKVTNREVVVDIEGNGEYTYVVEAVANEAENTIIKIMPGIYEGTVQAFQKRIILIGTDKNECILKSTLEIGVITADLKMVLLVLYISMIVLGNVVSNL